MRRRTLLAWGVGALLSEAEARAQGTAAFKVIANVKVAGEKIPRKLLSDVFLRKVIRWGDGTTIDPVDQSSASPIRDSFSRQILGQPPAALVQTYWAKEITAGHSRPPAVKGSDDEVIKFVAESKGGIGYVSPEVTLPETVKVLQLE